MKKNLFALCLVSLSFGIAFALPPSVQSVNRKTAVRCLDLAKSYLSSLDADNAILQAELGLSYDSTVSDLLYIKAAAKNIKGEARANLLPLVEKSLEEGEWVDYNRDGARILYADLLCDTGNYEKALSILDSKPFIYNADSEFIRTKAYYRMRTIPSVQKAREKINSARKIYSDDTRFPRLFFRNEHSLEKEFSADYFGETSWALVRKIADFFIAKMPEYENSDAELEVYAAMFASGEKQKRLLEAFSSHGMSHPLYASLCLSCGLMTQNEALEYVSAFADEKISLELLEDFFPLLTEEDSILLAREYLDSYSGLLTLDTNSDLEPELFVKYSRGRAESFYWDSNDDGIVDWSVKCDFGIPESIFLTLNDASVLYGTYPSVVKAVFGSSETNTQKAVFNLVDGAFEWSPFDIKVNELAKSVLGLDFFVPYPKKISFISLENLVASCSSYEVPCDEKDGALLTVLLLDGILKSAEYSKNGIVYAKGVFENGIMTSRSVDNDGDGVFETIEYFYPDEKESFDVDEKNPIQNIQNISELSSYGMKKNLRMVVIDRNGDIVPDFSEEILTDGGKIVSWDNDGDGNWDVRYVKYPQKDEASPLVEDSEFYDAERNLVVVTHWDGEPVSVQIGDFSNKVRHGFSEAFFWIGDEGDADDEGYILKNIDSSLEQGVSVIFEERGHRMLAVKIGNNIYAQIIPVFDTEEEDDSK